MSINYRILKACDHSPRHQSALVRALNELQSPTVVRCAALVHKMCRFYSIADFPNPFPRGEPEAMLWDEIFLDRTPLFDDDKPVIAAGPPRAWPKAWEDDQDQGTDIRPDPDAPPDQDDPNLAKPDLPVMDTEGQDTVRETETITAEDTVPLEDILGDILGDSSDAGAEGRPGLTIDRIGPLVREVVDDDYLDGVPPAPRADD